MHERVILFSALFCVQLLVLLQQPRRHRTYFSADVTDKIRVGANELFVRCKARGTAPTKSEVKQSLKILRDRLLESFSDEQLYEKYKSIHRSNVKLTDSF